MSRAYQRQWHRMLNAAIASGVKRAVVLSTDKRCIPSTPLLGISKAAGRS